MATRYPRQARPAPAIRTCVGCGVRAAKSDLLRVVAAGNEVVPDALARRPGRGAYLHPSQGCFEQAQRRRAFARALRLPGPLGTGRLAEYLVESGPDSRAATPTGSTNGGAGATRPGESRLRLR